MSLTFLFWLAAIYTVALFSTQMAELLSAGRFSLNIATANAFYLGILSAYVGGKEIKRWRGEETATARPLWLRGEWFVGLWALFLLAATFLAQIWPGRFAYPNGLTLIAFEVLGFYVGSGASAWLDKIKDQQTHKTIENQLEAEAADRGQAAPEAPPSISIPAPAPRPAADAASRLARKRARFEALVLDAARAPEGVTRSQTEKLLGLKRSAAGALLAGLVARGALRREGSPTDPEAAYRLPNA